MRGLGLFLLQLLSLVMLQNCGPREDTRPIFEIDQTTVDYCVYDEGSWWVYEEETSGERDTIVVTRIENSIDSNKHLGYKRKGYYSLYSTKIYTQTSSWTGPSYNLPELNGATESFVIPPHGYLDLLFISTLDTSFIYELSGIEQIKLKDTLSSLRIREKTYSDVRVFENLSGSYFKHQKVIYWARHIGKIRIERADGTIWNLIDYHVSQDNLK